MTNALLSPVPHDIQVSVVGAEEASLGVSLCAHGLAEALAEANRLLALH